MWERVGRPVLLFTGSADLDQVDQLSGGAMNRTDTHRRISALVRQSHGTSLYAVGYLTQDASSELLSELLAGLEEYAAPTDRPDHLAAYSERYGRLPDATS